MQAARSVSFRHLVLLGGGACLAALALALWLISARAGQILAQDLAAQALEGRAALAIAEMDRLRGTARAGAEALAAHPVAAATTAADRAAQVPTLVAVLRAMPGVSAAYLSWPDGDFLLLRPITGPAPDLDAPDGSAWLAQWIIGGVPRFDFADDSLQPIMSRSDVAYDLDPATRPWHAAAQSADQTVVTAPYVFFTTREPGITAARKAAGGTVAGVDISLADLSARLAGSDGADIVSALLDSAGGLLAYSDIASIGAVLRRFTDRADPLSPDLPRAEEVGSAALSELAARRRAGQDSFFDTARIDGQTLLVLARPVDDQGTTLVMHAPRSVFTAGVQDLGRNLLLLFVAATLIVLGLLWVAARLVARPVEAMVHHVERLATLDFGSARPIPSAVREMSRLGDAVMTMHRTIEGHSRILTDAVRAPDEDRLIGAVLAPLARMLGGDRAIFWPAGPTDDTTTGRQDSAPGEPLPVGPDVVRRLRTADGVTEMTDAPDGRRFVVIPLRSADNGPVGTVAIRRAAGASALGPQAIAAATSVAASLGLALGGRRLRDQHAATQA